MVRKARVLPPARTSAAVSPAPVLAAASQCGAAAAMCESPVQ